MCDAIVKKFPMWLPPNVITLMGFSFNVFPHLLMIAIYGNHMEGYVDSWVCVMLGISYFMFTTLDNCDGKQARRTSSGSPMGMLFDHGLDATTAILVMYPLGWIHQIGPGLPTLIMVMMSTIPFYCCTVQEYYLGQMILAAFSGPDDTSVAISLVCFIAAYFGS